MPAPTFRAASTIASGLNDVAITFPTGFAANDILVLGLEGANQSNAQAHTNLTNNNWIRVANTNTVFGTAATAQAVKLDIWWRRVTSNANTAVNIVDFGDHTMAVMAAYSNCVTTGDPWSTGTGAGMNVVQGTAVAQVTFSNITTSAANTLVLNWITGPNDSAAAFINASPVVIITSPSGDETDITERIDGGTTSGGGGQIGLIEFRKPSAGQTGNLRINLATSNVATMWTGALIGTSDAFPFAFSCFT